MSIEKIIEDLLNEEQNVYGIAIVGKNGMLITQTENWDLNKDLKNINDLIQSNPELGQKGMGSIEIQGIKYMIVENIEERKIGTSVTGKGHIIVCPIPAGGTGGLVCYINPQSGARDCLFTVQTYANKLLKYI